MSGYAASYGRFSSDLQNPTSVADQHRQNDIFATKQGWKIFRHYGDEAVSGFSLIRPGIQALLADAKNGHFQFVIAEGLERISRDLSDTARVFKELSFLGIKIFTLADGEVNDLHVGLKGTMNSLFLRDLSMKTKRGLRGRIEQGMAAGGVSFGYEVVREIDSSGKVLCGKRRINEQEADTVRRIFRNYATGKSPRGIAAELNAEGISGPRGGSWSPSTINGNKKRGIGILNNELYIGFLVWNRQCFPKDPTTGKRAARPNPHEALIVKEVPDLRIVDSDLWDRVKTRQAIVSRDTRPDAQPGGLKPAWESRRPRFLLSGLMRCGTCGHSFIKVSSHKFGCAAARDRGSAVCQNLLTVRYEEIERLFLESIKTNLMAPSLFKVFCQEFLAESNRLRVEERAAITTKQIEIDRINRDLKRLLETILGSDVSPVTIVDSMKAMERRKAFLVTEIAEAEKPEKLPLHPNMAEMYRRRVDALQVALADPKTKDEAFDLIRSLVKKITLTPDGDELRIEIEGELAGIMAICAEGKQNPDPLSGAGIAGKLKMVAGARFERATFRL
ncbi:MAG: recombinase family protein [Alphaproteobacteria bacterium]|nr:recombinase family protein [Alphaproteobacteria bacterium]